MRVCPECREYTLRDVCKKCEVNSVSVEPARFSPEDRYGEYRRRLKKDTKKREEKT